MKVIRIYPAKDHSKLTDVRNMTRDGVVPYYVSLIISEAPKEEIIRINTLILSKWSKAGLLYIKDKAWRGIDLI